MKYLAIAFLFSAGILLAQTPAPGPMVQVRPLALKSGRAEGFIGRGAVTHTISLRIEASGGESGTSAEWYIVGRNLTPARSGFQKPDARFFVDWGRIALTWQGGRAKPEEITSRAISESLEADAANIEGWIVRLIDTKDRVLAVTASSPALRAIGLDKNRWQELLVARAQPPRS